MSFQKGTASSSVVGQGGKSGWTGVSSGCLSAGKPTKLLNEREFSERIFIPISVSVQLVEGGPTLTGKAAHNTIFFSKEQFNAGLHFPLSSNFKQFLHHTQIPSAYIHPNIVRVLMGCNILNMFFHLDLFLLEVLFVYTIKKGKRDIFNMFTHIMSLQLVMGLPDSNKGGAKGHVLVWGPWATLIEHPERDFHPNCSLKIPDRDGSECHFLLLLFVELTPLGR